MQVTYGSGTYAGNNQQFSGTIILGEHKVFLKNQLEELAPTFVPLEKIERVRLKGNQMILTVRPAIMSRFDAVFQGDPRSIRELTLEIVNRRGLKKKWLVQEWFEVPA